MILLLKFKINSVFMHSFYFCDNNLFDRLRPCKVTRYYCKKKLSFSLIATAMYKQWYVNFLSSLVELEIFPTICWQFFSIFLDPIIFLELWVKRPKFYYSGVFEFVDCEYDDKKFQRSPGGRLALISTSPIAITTRSLTGVKFKRIYHQNPHQNYLAQTLNNRNLDSVYKICYILSLIFDSHIFKITTKKYLT